MDQIPEKYRSHVKVKKFFYPNKVEADGIRRRDAASSEKYKNRVFKCKLCCWACSNKYAPKAKEYKEERPAIWIFQDWKPQKLEDLKFIKS